MQIHTRADRVFSACACARDSELHTGKARYVEEHFTVYNLDDLNEHKLVLVRLSCGHVHQQAHDEANIE